MEARIRALIARIDPRVRIYFPRRRPWRSLNGVSWNGRHLRPTGLTLESQLHEVAHWLIAPAQRRAEPEFGLGPDPYRRNDTPRTVPASLAQREETHACWMQLLLARLLALDEAAVEYEYGLEPLTPSQVRVLYERYPHALSAEDWRQALDSIAPREPHTYIKPS